ncbi:poly-gamma-glutamate synthesis protein (capsule biosynthesis protein) [Halogranum amylolyticum]|uniref:Poly-gamma-glutamate synthesis protein (Capsule biosynthesis protein) n=1 Tax=Halogranum amylolyticum TaxID=660520 RepID=A0A1H8N201_9EURY|nr:CapA family protein [Halogranum amylolyticum]SEO23594.1 poly-gamma-glutamate synthesis protein (capsule biosynthesis protein) [Halogranum amylolyticum]
MDRLHLGFTGDVMLGRNVDDRQRAERRPPEAVWGSTYDRLRALDGLFVNLECCLSTRGSPWAVTYHPYHFRADPNWALPALTRAGVSWVTLANNHVLDFGADALDDTFDALDDAHIPFCGAGVDEDDAWQPAVVDVGELTVALVGFTDNTPEFAATDDSPGTAYFDVAREDDRSRVERALAAAHESDPDLVVASLHWGPNMVERPPKSFQRFAHWLVESGVDLVHGHSAHVFQGVELYRGVPILYDTGDFVDDYAVDPDLRNDRSFLFEVVVTTAGDVESVRLSPTEIANCSVDPAPAHVAEWSRDRMVDLSAAFGTQFGRDGESLVLDVESGEQRNDGSSATA